MLRIPQPSSPMSGRGDAQRTAGARRWLPLLLLAPAAAFALLPAPPRAEAWGCGGTDGPLCYIYEECERKWLIIEKCTTKYAYYPEFV